MNETVDVKVAVDTTPAPVDDREYIFTFGCGQQHENGFYAIEADNPAEARARMFEVFGSKWSMQYDAPNAREKAGVKQWKMHEVK